MRAFAYSGFLNSCLPQKCIKNENLLEFLFYLHFAFATEMS